ncbi:MAG: hypothetical protein KDB14_02375, partial [Planctomycetales bacterium]|nr:hypothetical protein [Planctomycetales bacterium]
GATVRGLIWNAGQTVLAGSVFGTVATTQFYQYASPTAYVNWLIDAYVDVIGRPDRFHLPLGFVGVNTPAVVSMRSWAE